MTPQSKHMDPSGWAKELQEKAPEVLASLVSLDTPTDELHDAFDAALRVLYGDEDEQAPPAPKPCPLLESLTSPCQTLTQALLGIDPTESPTAGSIYRKDDDPFEGVEVEEDGDTGDFEDEPEPPYMMDDYPGRFVDVWDDTREWLVTVEDLGDE